MGSTEQVDAGNAPAFAVSSSGTPEPLTVNEVARLTQYMAYLDAGGEWPALQALGHAFAYLRGDLSPEGSRTLDQALLAWVLHTEECASYPLTPFMVAWMKADDPVVGDLVRRLLNHLTAYKARSACDPAPPSAPMDDRDFSRVRVARRCKWDDKRTFNAEERAARVHDGEAVRPLETNRAERRAAYFGHAVEALEVPERLDEDPPPRRRPVTEPRTAHAPPRGRYAFAA